VYGKVGPVPLGTPANPAKQRINIDHHVTQLTELTLEIQLLHHAGVDPTAWLLSIDTLPPHSHYYPGLF
jgi:hypothetical protein